MHTFWPVRTGTGNSGASVGHYKNKLTALPDGQDYIETNVYGATVRSQIGQPVNMFYGYKTGVTSSGTCVYATTDEAAADGLYLVGINGEREADFGAGDVKFVDQNGDKIINEKDMQVIGNPNPDIYGNIFTSVTYKRLRLDINFNYSLGNDVFNYTRMQLESGSRFMNQTTAMVNRWRYEGQATDMPKVAYGDPMGNSRFSDRWIEDGSYLRLKSLTLSYELPINNTYIHGLTFWGQANNLFTLTRYIGLDPEFSLGNGVLEQGIDRGLLAHSRNFMLGIKTTFNYVTDMKYNSYIFKVIMLLAGVGAFTSSCEDMLESDSKFVIYDDHLKTPADTANSLVGIIYKLQAIAERTHLLGEVRGDLVSVKNTADQDLLQMANFTIDDDNVYNNPRDYYAVINNCNYYLAHADMNAVNTSAEKIFWREYVQVKAIRAWTYLQLALNYGSVQFYTEPILTEADAAKDYPRKNLQEICDFFIEDLTSDPNYSTTEFPMLHSVGNLLMGNCFFPVDVVLGDMYLWRASLTGSQSDYRMAAKRYASWIYRAGGVGAYRKSYYNITANAYHASWNILEENKRNNNNTQTLRDDPDTS